MKLLLTGGSKGIGFAMKEHFTNRGIEVLAPDRATLNLADSDSIRFFIQNTNLSDIDMLINNAGINDLNLIEDISEEELMNTIQVNLLSAFQITKTLLPIFKKNQFGRIVNIGSVWTQKSLPKRGSYGISKEGLYALTKMVAVEHSADNILCNMISPGFIETELTYKNNSKEQIATFLERVPCRRMGTPIEVAKLAYYLTVENTFITGQNIFIDGGYTVSY